LSNRDLSTQIDSKSSDTSDYDPGTENEVDHRDEKSSLARDAYNNAPNLNAAAMLKKIREDREKSG
ncbi:hypothetical protein N9V17_01270, partial [Candidatus Poseidoniales archaeon]|nr:hypothetical protein [Candidatus Poseidoniales archaeon]